MRQSNFTATIIFKVLDFLAIALVVAALLDFVLIRHDFVRPRIYLAVALSALTLAAIVVRLSRRQPTGNGTLTYDRSPAPLWGYGFAVGCALLSLVTSTTNVGVSITSAFGIAVLAGLGLIALIVQRVRANAKARLRFTPVQKVGIALAVGGLLFCVARLVSAAK
jgi:FtsH-binding integral membrane protein